MEPVRGEGNWTREKGPVARCSRRLGPNRRRNGRVGVQGVVPRQRRDLRECLSESRDGDERSLAEQAGQGSVENGSP